MRVRWKACSAIDFHSVTITKQCNEHAPGRLSRQNFRLISEHMASYTYMSIQCTTLYDQTTPKGDLQRRLKAHLTELLAAPYPHSHTASCRAPQPEHCAQVRRTLSRHAVHGTQDGVSSHERAHLRAACKGAEVPVGDALGVHWIVKKRQVAERLKALQRAVQRVHIIILVLIRAHRAQPDCLLCRKRWLHKSWGDICWHGRAILTHGVFLLLGPRAAHNPPFKQANSYHTEKG